MEADDFGSNRPTMLTNVPVLLRDNIQQIAARADLSLSLDVWGRVYTWGAVDTPLRRLVLVD